MLVRFEIELVKTEIFQGFSQHRPAVGCYRFHRHRPRRGCSAETTRTGVEADDHHSIGLQKLAYFVDSRTEHFAQIQRLADVLSNCRHQQFSFVLLPQRLFCPLVLGNILSSTKNLFGPALGCAGEHLIAAAEPAPFARSMFQPVFRLQNTALLGQRKFV